MWYAYLEPNPNSAWFNGQTYVDTMNKKATERFLELTHSVYEKQVGEFFGNVIPSIFTDEPQFAHKTQLKSPWAKLDVFLPWSLDLADTFQAQFGHDVYDSLPELVWDLPSTEVSRVRYQYHDHVCTRFVEGFMDVIAHWCRNHNIALLGHMMKEPFLWTQTGALGEAMRCYRNLDVPGIDLLCDRFEFNTVKQAVSVARQNNGIGGAMSEIYGVTNWTFDFVDHKGCGDWQAALGITFRVPHLAWVSMAGEGKRDFPAAIGYQSSWYKEYTLIEDYFSRVNIALTRGKPVCRIGVIHPVESYWLCFGPTSENASEQQFREDAFADLSNWLLHGLMDFDFISESLFVTQCHPENIDSPALSVGLAQYDVVIVPNMRTIRSTTVERLNKFTSVGGKVFVAGTGPTLIDGQDVLMSKTPLADAAPVLWSRHHILEALEPYREIKAVIENEGTPAQTLLHQIRQDGDDRYVFICNTDRKEEFRTDITFKGEWHIVVLDALCGQQHPQAVYYNGEWTGMKWVFGGGASLLLRLSPKKESETSEKNRPRNGQMYLADHFTTVGTVKLFDVKLTEPNVLLLDYAKYKFDDDELKPVEEVLRIDNIARRHYGLPLKLEAFRQPWTLTTEERKSVGPLHLVFEFLSEVEVAQPALAIEASSEVGIKFNNLSVPSIASGFWVDEDIHTVPLPSIKKGTNVLELIYNFNITTNIERVYILGDFGVSVAGHQAHIIPLNTSTLRFGDFTRQGLPFYAGDILYECSLSNPTPGPVVLEIPHFKAPVITVAIHAQPEQVFRIAFPPYQVCIGDLPAGTHTLSIRAFGNRNNAFGPTHLPDGLTRWIAPNVWRTEHVWWQDSYNIKAMGIFEEPRVLKEGKRIYEIQPYNEKKTY